MASVALGIWKVRNPLQEKRLGLIKDVFFFPLNSFSCLKIFFISFLESFLSYFSQKNPWYFASHSPFSPSCGQRENCETPQQFEFYRVPQFENDTTTSAQLVRLEMSANSQQDKEQNDLASPQRTRLFLLVVFFAKKTSHLSGGEGLLP